MSEIIVTVWKQSSEVDTPFEKLFFAKLWAKEQYERPEVKRVRVTVDGKPVYDREKGQPRPPIIPEN